MNKCLALSLIALDLLVTGCPSDQYVVELTPRGPVMQRTLTFWCEDGASTNGVPNYSTFAQKPLENITALYPRGAMKQDGELRSVTGNFAGNMPPDVGGAGTYTNFTTRLGSAAFYSERFRGDADLAAKMTKRLHAADQLTDLIIGWSRAEFGRERHYQDLRRFIDVEFRRDLKNLSVYAWLGQIANNQRQEDGVEFVARFGQYLVERGYFKANDLPNLYLIWSQPDDVRLPLLIQRLVAAKLGVPASKPMPPSLAFLANGDATAKSFVNYLATTDVYHARLWEWKKQKLLGTYLKRDYIVRELSNALHFRGTNVPPTPQGPPQPDPSDVASELVTQMLQFGLFGTEDHVKVKLSLPSPPLFTNGKWDETNKVVFWNCGLPSDELAPIPSFCFATWAAPDEAFQNEHFGRVILSGPDLVEYCLWCASLDAASASEWDALLADLHSGADAASKVHLFLFTKESIPGAPGAPPVSSDIGRRLLESGLEKKSAEK